MPFWHDNVIQILPTTATELVFLQPLAWVMAKIHKALLSFMEHTKELIISPSPSPWANYLLKKLIIFLSSTSFYRSLICLYMTLGSELEL